MVNDDLLEFRESLETAFVDRMTDSNLALKPRFLSNNHVEGQKILSVLDDELSSCEEFSISVAFITKGGITPLLQTLKDLEKKGVKGRILTTDYLMFSEPDALKKLSLFSNIELKMYRVKNGPGFHTKGYLFKDKEFYKIIVGSANMTLSALTVNHEWNTRIVSTGKGEMAHEILHEFEALWNSKNSLAFEAFYEDYKTKYEVIAKQREVAAKEQIVPLDVARLEPNAMQVAFINRLKELIAAGADKALLISATGDGGIIVPSQAKTA